MFSLEDMVKLVEEAKKVRCPDCHLQVGLSPEFVVDEEGEVFGCRWVIVHGHDPTCPWLNSHPEIIGLNVDLED